jgi:GSH-dependent disulfide-bond oxidoreductase
LIQLYTAASGNGHRATIMLEECGLPYKAHFIEVGPSAKKPAEFLRINPAGTVPVIVDPDGPGGRPITIVQSGAILLYLAEKSRKFIPQDPIARINVLQWTMLVLTDIAPTGTAVYFSATRLAFAGREAAGFWEIQFINLLGTCDRQLALSKYLAGDEVTVADLALLPVVAGRRKLIDGSEGLDHVKRWMFEMIGRPAVAKALAAAT